MTGVLEQAVSVFLAKVPLQTTSDFGVTSVEAYAGIPQAEARLSDRPYTGQSVAFVHSFLGLSKPVQLVERARLAVLGEVIAIGPPYFNSDSGGFWDPALHDEPGVVDAANQILRDVLFRVDEVWGSAVSGVEPGDLLSFASIGGQIEVTISQDVAKKLEFAAGTYVYSVEPPVDLSVGEQALLFLDYEPLDGLYEGRYGYKFVLYPAHELYYKYRLEGEVAINSVSPALSLSIDELRGLISEHLGTRAGPEAQPGVFSKPKHPPVSEDGGHPQEESEPPHTHGEG